MASRILVSICTIAAVIAAAGAAVAAPLASATLTIRSDDFGIAPVSFPAVGATGVASSSGVSLDAGHAFDGSVIAPSPGFYFGTWFYSSLGIAVLGNGAGNLAGTPIGGHASFSLRLVPNAGVPPGSSFPFTPFQITIGAPATRYHDLFVPTTGGTLSLRIVGTSWEEASNALTPAGAGVLNLVTPIVFHSPIWAGPPIHTMYADLQLVFVPEPATALVLGWGVVCLGIAGRRRMRAR